MHTHVGLKIVKLLNINGRYKLNEIPNENIPMKRMKKYKLAEFLPKEIIYTLAVFLPSFCQNKPYNLAEFVPNENIQFEFLPKIDCF